jgi:hypothetical protein
VDPKLFFSPAAAGEKFQGFKKNIIHPSTITRLSYPGEPLLGTTLGGVVGSQGRRGRQISRIDTNHHKNNSFILGRVLANVVKKLIANSASTRRYDATKSREVGEHA